MRKKESKQMNVGDYWRDRKVLVTGAGGFIGSHLVERLVELGADVIGVVRYNSKGQWGWLSALPLHVSKRVKVMPCDLAKEQPTLRDGVDVVFHLAAIMDIGPEYITTKRVLENNFLCTLNILEAIGSPSTVFANVSSFEVYEGENEQASRETDPLKIRSPYVASTIISEQLVETYCGGKGLQGINIRLFSTYGPRENTRAVIPTIILQAMKGQAIGLGIMDTERDFIFISDSVEGMIKLAESDLSAFKNPVTVNLGSGKRIKIADLAERIANLVSKGIEVSFDPLRIRLSGDDIVVSYADIELLKTITGWEPMVSLDEGLKKTIAWIGSRLSEHGCDTV